ncbi:MAG: hypothetical protein QQW96_21395 [Tychonema bourrellyi B0820]|uniref:hypothetical protein n=1 Tax=Tychonema bourrellyi TaxID=54313 RepID=UPI0015D483D6|nr:hypothetical protein [Tychonema bourrellyi]MDQ2100192.1 hypothetical protein [Tychonema bourrellyi B0820]
MFCLLPTINILVLDRTYRTLSELYLNFTLTFSVSLVNSQQPTAIKRATTGMIYIRSI